MISFTFGTAYKNIIRVHTELHSQIWRNVATWKPKREWEDNINMGSQKQGLIVRNGFI
jgi:hypothetical protein